MIPLPSPSCVTLRKYDTSKVFSKRKYVPNLSASRTSKVKTTENEEVKEVEKNVATLSDVGRKYFSTKKDLRGAETFVAASNSSNSDLPIRGGPKITDSTSNNHLDGVNAEVSDVLSDKDSSMTSDSNSSTDTSCDALPNLPLVIPRPQLSIPKDVMEFFDLNRDEPLLFVLKTPKYLPGIIDCAKPESSSQIEMQKCRMGDLPEGQIGTLQILKSNRLRLVLGECVFWLHRGVHVDFREELAFVSVDTDARTGEVVNLGKIEDRIIAVPGSVTTFAKDCTF